MKPTILSVLFFICSICLVQAQSTLPDSPRRSSETHIYKLDKTYFRKIYLQEEEITENMLGEFVASYKDSKDFPKLPRGNYVLVSAIEHQLNFTDHVEDDLYFRVVPAGDFMLCLYDSLGRMIEDAVVKCGSKSLKYDKRTQTYNASKIKDGQIIEVNNKGVYHYIEIEKNDYYYVGWRKNIFRRMWRNTRYTWSKTKHWIRGLFDADYRDIKDKYTGFVVFSKPRYKPGETVKLKAHVTTLKGKPFHKPVTVRLYAYYPFRVDTVLTTLKPYRPGMFAYEFNLSDSLGLRLDADYTIGLEMREDKYKYNDVTGRFRYEEYELKSSRFSMTTDKEEHARGDSVRITLKATDENEMAQYGGRAEIYVIPERIGVLSSPDYRYVFVPDTLWHEEVDMGESSEKSLTLPGSVFPAGLSLHYKVNAIYLSADNEKKEVSKRLCYDARDYKIDFELVNGMLTIRQLHKGESQAVEAHLSIAGENEEKILQETVRLPYTLPVPWYGVDITVKTKEGHDCFYLDKKRKGAPFAYHFYRHNDSVFVQVDNPAEIPFWYVIRKKNRDIASGYTTQLDYRVKDKGEGYSLQLSYLFGEDSRRLTQSLPFVLKNISLHVATPTVVYPGQQTDVKVSVTDRKGKPVPDADITAYSFTTKFNASYAMPDMMIRGIQKSAKGFRNSNYNPEVVDIISRKGKMSWERWREAFTLDTVEYYKFLYPEISYHYSEPSFNGATQVSPYVVVDGVLQSVVILWIDDKMYYTNLAGQYEEYIFQVDPGMHTIRFRTHDREVTVRNVYLTKGTKNIISFDAGKEYAKLPYADRDRAPLEVLSHLLKKEEWGQLSNRDISYLSRQLITIENNFGTMQLPGTRVSLPFPAYIHSGHTHYYLNYHNPQRYNAILRSSVYDPVLVGPFPARNRLNDVTNVVSVFAQNRLVAHLDLEAGNQYTVYENYQKIKEWKEQPFQKELKWKTPPTDFRRNPIQPEDMERMFRERIEDHLRTLNGSIQRKPGSAGSQTGRLTLSLGTDKAGNAIRPTLIFLVPEKKKDIAGYGLFYGGTRYVDRLSVGNMTLHLVINDTTSFSQPVYIQAGGENYVRIDSIVYEYHSHAAKNAYRLFDRQVKKTYPTNPYLTSGTSPDSIAYAESDYAWYYSKDEYRGTMTGVILDPEGMPVIGASVVVKGTTNGTVTGFDGEFELEGVKPGDQIVVSYIGYRTDTYKYVPGKAFVGRMTEDAQILRETVVVGYGTMKTHLTGSIGEILPVSPSPMLTGAAKGVRIRGTASPDSGGSPLIIVNGLPYNGNLSDLDPGIIRSINVLKDANATRIYGSRAGEGVILVQTTGFPMDVAQAEVGAETAWEGADKGNSLRRNFHDDAFWQPRLRTNKEGVASFEVTYPDDITSWDTYFVAIGNKKQVDKKQMTIKSYKALSSRLSLPQFAVRGDSLNAVGRIANHLEDSIKAIRKIDVKGTLREDHIRLSTSHVDYIPVVATTGDSLKVTYSLEMANGYFDGEERRIPIYEQGMLQTAGDFRMIDDNETHTLKIDQPLPGNITIRAEASSLNLFLAEIEQVDRYPYWCNEQMASKIKVLLAKKQICEILGMEFEDAGKINTLIFHLNKNKNREGFWGWWNQSSTELWISKQVISALLEAEKAGYTANVDHSLLAGRFEADIRQALSDLRRAAKKDLPYAKQELLDRLIYLKRLNADTDPEPYFREIDAQLEDQSVTDRLKTMQAMSVLGLEKEIVPDSLMKYARTTMLGSMYWGDKQKDVSWLRTDLLPYRSHTENTLIAYQILKNRGGYEDELRQIRSYFFESRRNGFWQNTYESSRIVETLLPDMIDEGGVYSEVAMYINGSKISDFPYIGELPAGATIDVRKEGTLPLFVTAWQQGWNPAPQAESTKGFSVKSYFKANNDTITHLTAGKVTQLQVVVQVEGDTEYIQIEVPIPAGCSYETKAKGSYYGKEVHREHFRNKVVIFSNRLSEGEHTFTVELIPRYTGVYHVNPAKVELMYFPTFYGNEEMKKIRIE